MSTAVHDLFRRRSRSYTNERSTKVFHLALPRYASFPLQQPCLSCSAAPPPTPAQSSTPLQTSPATGPSESPIRPVPAPSRSRNSTAPSPAAPSPSPASSVRPTAPADASRQPSTSPLPEARTLPAISPS